MGWFGRKKNENDPKQTPQTPQPSTMTIPPNAMSPLPYQMRDSLFGDRPMEMWPPANNIIDSEPWLTFDKARKLYASGKKAEAMGLWWQIAQTKNLESRHYLQAWTFLRAAGFTPKNGKKLEDTDLGKFVYGVGIEVSMEGGLDSFAVYADFSVRYYNYTGAGSIIDTPVPALQHAIPNMFTAANALAEIVPPHTEPGHPPAPSFPNAAVYLYTPGGLRFAIGPAAVLQYHKDVGPVMLCGTAIITVLGQLRNQQQ